MKNFYYNKNRGFTLVELMVSLALFSIVMVVAIGAMLSIVDGNKKTQSLQVAMNNLNYTLESMNRYMQTGNSYEVVPDCSRINFTKKFKNSPTAVRMSYYLVGGRIALLRDVGATPEYLTAPEMEITDLCFKVFDESNLTTVLQPAVMVVVKGTAKAKGNLKSDFNIHTSLVQRDI